MKKHTKWIIQIFLITFILSLLFNSISSIVIDKLNMVIAISVLVLIIAINILFDIIGVAITVCSEASFHAKAAKKHIGAKEVIKLLKKRENVSSICNDVVGDVSGIVSGSISALISIKLAETLNIDIILLSLLIGATVASITVGGKAIGKTYAIKKSEDILYFVGAVIHYIAPAKEKKSQKKNGV